MEETVVKSEIEELRDIQRQVRAWQWGFFVVLALVALFCTLSVKNSVSSLVNDEQTRTIFVTKLTGGMQDVILPKLQEVGKEVVKQVDLQKQVDKLKNCAPEVANSAMKEMRTLSTNIPKKGKEVLTKEFNDVLEQKLDKLKTEFPDTTEEDLQLLMAKLTDETKVQLEDVVDSMFAPHVESMNNIVADMKKIQASEGGAKDEIPTLDMAMLFVDIARADLQEPEKTITPAARPAEKAPAAKAPKTGKGN